MSSEFGVRSLEFSLNSQLQTPNSPTPNLQLLRQIIEAVFLVVLAEQIEDERGIAGGLDDLGEGDLRLLEDEEAAIGILHQAAKSIEAGLTFQHGVHDQAFSEIDLAGHAALAD